ncbi:receptor-like protein 18 [Camellia sinensis]|uniref:receptor-like protein 18 n=1 Tax=Camellia sinensis TaxID=4442 RepID=UPI0010359449|nr:receptor-like protein 18 [Camellia sinensis]
MGKNSLKDLDLSNNFLTGLEKLSCLNSLKVLDLSNINFSGIIPHCLGNFSIYKRNSFGIAGLVLRFNRFHGHIDAFKTKSKVPFTKLMIIDISYDEFSGLLPTNYIKKFEAVMNVDEHAMKLKLKYMGDIYYYDYVVVIMKGHEIEFSRILTIMSIIDLSSNKFIGEISKSIGRLNSLLDLNLSHNLKGHIPTSLGNLKNLESLDLSSNKFLGEIPQ